MLRGALAAADRVSPTLASALAARAFFATTRAHRPEREAALLRRAERSRVVHDGRRIAIWSWGHGPVVLLVHGWNGRGSQLASFVEPLQARGRRVVAFDALGHGDSDGASASLMEIASTIRAVAQEIGDIDAVVAHSMGGAATVLAIADGLRVGRLALVAPPVEMESWVHRFAEAMGLSEPARHLLRARVERRNGIALTNVSLLPIASQMNLPLLVAHDRDDLEIPWESSRSLAQAWPAARLLTTEGLGHRRILREPEVVRSIVGFVAPQPDVERSGRDRLTLVAS